MPINLILSTISLLVIISNLVLGFGFERLLHLYLLFALPSIVTGHLSIRAINKQSEKKKFLVFITILLVNYFIMASAVCCFIIGHNLNLIAEITYTRTAIVLCFWVVVFWVWMIIDCATSKNLIGSDKIVWTIIIVFTLLVGAILYFFIARRGK